MHEIQKVVLEKQQCFVTYAYFSAISALWDKGVSYTISSFKFFDFGLSEVSELILMKTGITVSFYMQELEGKTWPKSKEVYG